MDSSENTTKRCPRCKQHLPATLEFFNYDTKYGLSSYCKPCTKQYHRSRYTPDVSHHRDIAIYRAWNAIILICKAHRTCIVCGKLFFDKRRTATLCSDECWSTWNRDRAKDGMRKLRSDPEWLDAEKKRDAERSQKRRQRRLSDPSYIQRQLEIRDREIEKRIRSLWFSISKIFKKMYLAEQKAERKRLQAERIAWKQSDEYKAQKEAKRKARKKQQKKNYYAKYPDRRRIEKKKNEIAHPDKKKKRQKKKDINRRAKERQATGSYTTDDLVAQAKRQKHKCYWCGAKLGKIPHQDYLPDHVIPLSKSLDNSASNIVAACRKCNSSKTDKMPWEWSGNNGRMF